MNSFISWIGGKKLLRKEIIKQFPEQFSRYIEVFGGAGWVLFGKEPTKMEIYNDVDGELVNLYRCIKCHPEAVQKELDGILMSREIFFDCRQQVKGLTDIQRAARFFVLIKESYGANCESFGARPRNLQKATDFLKAASDRLQNVVIENVDFERLIKTYDREDALFYLDPPYYQAEKYYQNEFSKEDHERLRNALDKMKGKFVLSYNDHEEVKKLYEAYNITEVERQDNLLARSGGRRYKELIIKNY